MKLDISDEQLAVLAQMGDSRASEILLNKFKHLVKGICKKYYIAGASDEDIIQEGMIGLYKAIINFDPEKNNSFQAFASMCVKHRVLSKINSANRKNNIPLNTSISLNKPIKEDGSTLGELLEDDKLDPESMFIISEKKQSTRKRISTMLSPLEKRILIEYLKDRSYLEIAKKLQITPKSVDNAMQRIKNKISRLKV
ncbi:MAG: sigma-70 family RNA polymerase sigma factor [Clostridia bacterium]|nr:sigma-70 family RNA polymerase sigma factor [Clostridia bacterium]